MARSPLASFVARCGAVKGCPAGPHDTPRAHRDSPSPPLQHAPRPSPAPTLLTADDLLGLHDEVKSRVEAMLHRKGATPDATVAQAGDEPVACGDEACVVDGMGNQPVWRIYVVEVEGTLRLHGIAQLSLGAVGVDWAEAARAHVDRVLADASQHPCSSLAAAPGARAGGGAAR